LHVSSCYLSSFVFLDEQRKKFPFFFAWATLVGVSTLTTKQHYIIDVVAGFALAVVSYWIVHRYLRYKDLKTWLGR
jgi:membrane-associated phospholipid phosphatase